MILRGLSEYIAEGYRMGQVSSPAQGAVAWTRMRCSCFLGLGMGTGRNCKERDLVGGSKTRVWIVEGRLDMVIKDGLGDVLG